MLRNGTVVISYTLNDMERERQAAILNDIERDRLRHWSLRSKCLSENRHIRVQPSTPLHFSGFM